MLFSKLVKRVTALMLAMAVCMGALPMAGAANKDSVEYFDHSAARRSTYFVPQDYQGSVNINELQWVEVGRLYPTNTPITRTTPYSVLYTTVARSGNTERCYVYFRFSGNAMITNINFDRLEFKDTNILFPQTYASLFEGIAYGQGATDGSAYVDYISIPVNITANSANFGALGSIPINSTVTIN